MARKVILAEPRVQLWQWEFILRIRLMDTAELLEVQQTFSEIPDTWDTSNDLQWCVDQVNFLVDDKRNRGAVE